MKKTALKRISKKRSDWLALYHEKRDKDNLIQECFKCGVTYPKHCFDAHHIRGRAGKLILEYVYLCRSCHEFVHENPNKAREMGLLNISTNGYRNQNV